MRTQYGALAAVTNGQDKLVDIRDAHPFGICSAETLWKRSKD